LRARPRRGLCRCSRIPSWRLHREQPRPRIRLLTTLARGTLSRDINRPPIARIPAECVCQRVSLLGFIPANDVRNTPEHRLLSGFADEPAPWKMPNLAFFMLRTSAPGSWAGSSERRKIRQFGSHALTVVASAPDVFGGAFRRLGRPECGSFARCRDVPCYSPKRAFNGRHCPQHL
jgi:hypothetical protein